MSQYRQRVPRAQKGFSWGTDEEVNGLNSSLVTLNDDNEIEQIRINGVHRDIAGGGDSGGAEVLALDSTAALADLQLRVDDFNRNYVVMDDAIWEINSQQQTNPSLTQPFQVAGDFFIDLSKSFLDSRKLSNGLRLGEIV